MIKIRIAKERDLDTCEKLSKQPELQTPEGDYPTARYLKNFIGTSLFFIAENRQKLLGTLQAKKLEAM